MKTQVILAGALVLLAATAAQADPHFGQLATSVVDSQSGQDVFKPDTPKIVLHAEMVEMPPGTKLDADWIAEKTDAAPANYKIDTSHVLVETGSNEASFALSKPDAGWPVGDYRVDLFIDGKPANSVAFKVAP
jgi:hypothetical protein